MLRDLKDVAQIDDFGVVRCHQTNTRVKFDFISRDRKTIIYGRAQGRFFNTNRTCGLIADELGDIIAGKMESCSVIPESELHKYPVFRGVEVWQLDFQMEPVRFARWAEVAKLYEEYHVALKFKSKNGCWIRLGNPQENNHRAECLVSDTEFDDREFQRFTWPVSQLNKSWKIGLDYGPVRTRVSSEGMCEITLELRAGKFQVVFPGHS